MMDMGPGRRYLITEGAAAIADEPGLIFLIIGALAVGGPDSLSRAVLRP